MEKFVIKPTTTAEVVDDKFEFRVKKGTVLPEGFEIFWGEVRFAWKGCSIPIRKVDNLYYATPFTDARDFNTHVKVESESLDGIAEGIKSVLDIGWADFKYAIYYEDEECGRVFAERALSRAEAEKYISTKSDGHKYWIEELRIGA